MSRSSLKKKKKTAHENVGKVGACSLRRSNLGLGLRLRAHIRAVQDPDARKVKKRAVFTLMTK